MSRIHQGTEVQLWNFRNHTALFGPLNLWACSQSTEEYKVIKFYKFWLEDINDSTVMQNNPSLNYNNYVVSVLDFEKFYAINDHQFYIAYIKQFLKWNLKKNFQFSMRFKPAPSVIPAQQTAEASQGEGKGEVVGCKQSPLLNVSFNFQEKCY